MSARGPLVLLLAVQDAGPDLASWLDAATSVADTVVALDRESRDGTAEVLARHPLVSNVLRDSPASEGLGYNLLLHAAADLHPGWVLILSSNERVVFDDAEPLRSFVHHDALPGIAYGLRLMRAAGTGYDLVGPVTYRLFSYADDLRLPAVPSPLALVPTAIPTFRWVPTTLRLQSTAGPAGSIPDGWTRAEGVPGVVRPWSPRPGGTSVLDLSAAGAAATSDYELNAPVLSVIVEGGPADALEQTLRSVATQKCSDDYEVVLVVPTGQSLADSLIVVRVVTSPAATPAERRRAGLDASTGEFVLFLTGGTLLLPGCLEAHVRAHDRGYRLVAGTVLNGTGTRVGWASYFLSRSASLPGRASTEPAAPPPGCSYERRLLDEVGPPGPGDAGEVGALLRLEGPGMGVWRAVDSRRIESPCARTPLDLIRERFAWGRIIAGAAGRDLWLPSRLGRTKARLAWMATFGSRELSRVDTNVVRWGDGLVPVYRRARPWVLAGTLAAWAGACTESMGGRRGRRPGGA